MNGPPPDLPPAPPADGGEPAVSWLLWAGLALGAAFASTTLRIALHRSLAERVLALARTERHRERLTPLLVRVEGLGTSAGLIESASDALFAGLVLAYAFDLLGDPLWIPALLGSLVAATVILVVEALAAAVARARGDRLLARTLPAFHLLQLPLSFVSRSLGAVRRAFLRAVGVRDELPASRRLVAGLREVLEDVDPHRDLDPTERELIENVIELRDVDAAEIMTPRTEVCAAAVADGVERALGLALDEGWTRVPVYGDSIDTIIGTAHVHDLVRAQRDGRLDEAALRSLLRPPFLVPETKLVSELLLEFRARREKAAIVVDEYGGTAGLVTVTDVLRELVGDLPEPDEELESIQPGEDGAFEVPASLHVSEVNEALELDLPEEEDFETLGGFVLARLGRLPEEGDRFEEAGAGFTVVEASDRRVLRVRVERRAQES